MRYFDLFAKGQVRKIILDHNLKMRGTRFIAKRNKASAEPKRSVTVKAHQGRMIKRMD